jgi:hypothetical protein
MATDPNVLMSNVSCLDCTVPQGLLLPVLIALLDNLSSSTSMATDPNTLIAQAVCIDCNIPQGMQMPVLIGLIAAISSGGGGTITGGVSGMTGNYAGGAPTSTPTSAFAMAVDTSNNEVWIFFGSAWHDTGMATQ